MEPRTRVGAVSYLNTVPLVWGMLHGDENAGVELSFSLPSVCAERIESGLDDVGIVPVAEIPRQDLEIVSDVGITCDGAVRSILLSSRVPFRQIRTLAADESSRTSVHLARVILREHYGVEPRIQRAAPNLNAMLTEADAALVIGDPALRLEPSKLPWETLDLGTEWQSLTGLPMVFALWAGRSSVLGRGGLASRLRSLTRSSFEFGRAHIREIVASEYGKREVSRELAEEYLTRYIRFEIGARERSGLQVFYELAGLNRQVAV